MATWRCSPRSSPTSRRGWSASRNRLRAASRPTRSTSGPTEFADLASEPGATWGRPRATHPREAVMHRIHIPRPAHATVVAYLALFVAMSGTAVAATGGSFVLGRVNTASKTSTLTSRAGAPLSLVAPPGRSPLRVSSARQVSLLNADLLDGLHGRAFARRLCHNGPA